MAKKQRLQKSNIRTAPKLQEKYLIDNAKKLYENPFLIIPECKDDYGKNSFKKVRKKLDKIHRIRDNTEKLEKISKKKGLAAALAGTLLLAESEKAPYLAVAKFSWGNAVYAQRGNAETVKLVAMQHVDDPVLRLLGIKDVVLKKNLHVYSWDGGFVCTGREARPPKEFVNFVVDKLGFEVKKNNVVSCKHLLCDQVVKNECLEKFYLRIWWKSADQLFALCEDCAKTSKNTVFALSKYFLEPHLSNDFTVDVVAEVISDKNSGTGRKTLFLDEYFSGAVSDYELIQKNVKKQHENIRQVSKRLLVIDGISYGADNQKFITALHPNKYERIGLEYILNKVDEPVVISDASPYIVLDKFWKQYGKELVSSLIVDVSMAESFMNLDETPSNIIKLVVEYNERQQILSQLPTYPSLPPLAQFIDHIAKTYKTYGEKKTLSELKKRLETTKGKAITYAFLLALGKAEEKKWQYATVEIEYGEFLKEYAEKLLNASPQEYSAMLQELLTASGSGETLPHHTTV